MIFGRSERGKPPVEPVTLKILVAGGFGVGKTTLVGAVSEIKPLRTEELLSEAGRPLDDIRGVEGKHTTTVAMDFGRITLREDLVLYLFGTPGQDRFDFMWEILGEGMIGYLLLVDASREDSVQEAAGILDAFRTMARVPYVVALNRASAENHALVDSVRQQLQIPSDVAILECDATDKESVKNVLLALLYAVLDEVETEAVRA
jgi:signal recognition particle receptor subunit beta